ncbi:MAG: MBL fold metallo-hydrolase [Alistipes sp.]|nr:MBL fold metallo-hydrolase [Alistipes sp.]
MKKILPIVLCCAAVSCASEEQVGDIYRGWQDGQMEIHHIYTGRGESSFIIMPDATTMLIDVGDHDPTVEQYALMTEALPDRERRAGEYVARYVERVNPEGKSVDYLMLSHFHNDHMGTAAEPAAMTTDRDPNYYLAGIAEAGEFLHFDMLYDRGYPDYNYPFPINDKHTANYLAFANYHKAKYGMQQEKFEVGELNQIKLKNNPQKYPSFSVRNLASSGEVWSGREGETVRCYDLNPANLTGYNNENTRSIALRFDYGPFSYYSGGDISGSLRDVDGNMFNVESLVGEVCGEVDVCKANHHSYKDAMPEDFLRAVQAKQYILNVWDQQHTQPELMARMMAHGPASADPRIFSGYITEAMRNDFATEEWASGINPENGHIVIKVYDEGRKYKIYSLSARDELMTIQAIYGPYDAM